MNEEKNIVYTVNNDKNDEIKLILHPNGHLRMIWDFAKDFTPEKLKEFISLSNYKVISVVGVKPNLKLVKGVKSENP